MNIKNILLPTDFSDPAKQATQYAMGLCKVFDASAYLVHAIDANPYAMYGEYTGWQRMNVADEIKTSAEKQMDALIREFGNKAPITGHNVVTTDSVADTICETASEQKADLIVMSTHGRTGVNRVLMGSVAEQVVRQASCPVLTLGKTFLKSTSKAKVDLLLHPTDFSTEAEKAAKMAIKLCGKLDAKLDVLHVIDDTHVALLYTHPIVQDEPLHEKIRERAIKDLDEYVEKIRQDYPVKSTLELCHGNAAAKICEFAEENKADWIVMSTHGRTGVKRLFLGSIAERVLRTAPCPVLTLK